ncbi:MauE/DoxX family redox-associated membrane protein [Microbispora rosea]|uniref:MauE/DoxX family redox-associated membrane protein n=1 Tax=Microbispora rosea TaxID=58117 RepID=UPI003447DB76
MGYVGLSLRLALAGVFLLSALGKARDRAAFVTAVRRIGRVRGRRAPTVVAVLVAAGEAAAALTLPWPSTAPYGLALAGTLLVAFTVALGVAVRAGTGEPCACFGSSPAPVAPRHLVRNAVLLAAVLVASLPVRGAVPAPVESYGVPEVVACLLAAAAVTVPVAALDRLTELLGPLWPFPRPGGNRTG